MLFVREIRVGNKSLNIMTDRHRSSPFRSSKLLGINKSIGYVGLPISSVGCSKPVSALQQIPRKSRKTDFMYL